MKKFLPLILALALPLGCATASTTPPPAANAPVANGYLNPADQQMGQVLAGARNFYVSIQTQSVQGTLTLSASVKKAFNDFGVSLNTADAIYLAYHNGTATQSDAQNAVNAVQSKQAALPLPGGNQ